MKKSLVVTIISASLVAVMFASAPLTKGATIDELKQKINATAQAQKDLEAEIAKYREELNRTVSEANGLKSTIQVLDLSVKKIGTDLKVTESKIDQTNYTIQKLALDIAFKERSIDRSRQALADAVRGMEMNDENSAIETLLMNKDLSAFWNETETLAQFQTKVNEHVAALKTMRDELRGYKMETEVKKNDLVGLKTQLADQKTAVETNKQEKDRLLKETKNQEAAYRRIIADKEAKKKAFEAELLEFESQLKIAIDPKSVPNAKKGVLSWPTDKVIITQYFGNTAFAQAHSKLYNGKGHSGIDLGVPIGTPIKAALSGTVEGTGNTDAVCPGASYGKWVFVRHPNGLATLYAHLSSIKVSEGQSVTTGETVGLSGVTGYATGPHLHFTVFASQGVKILSRKSASCGGTYVMPVADLRAYLNPLDYL